MSQSYGPTKVDKLGSLQGVNHRNVKQSRLKTGPPRAGGYYSHLEFQDSNLSPGLALLPANPAGEANATRYSWLQKSDMEFLPLRACPDFSMVSERTGAPPAEGTTLESDEASLSQHPLAQETLVSAIVSSGCCSPSQLILTSEDNAPEEKEKVNAVDGSQLETFSPSEHSSIDAHSVMRECPPGEAAEVSHITSGSRSTQPDTASELLYRELLSQSERGSSHIPRSTPQEPEPVTSYGPETSDSGTNVTRPDQESAPISANIEPGLWCSGNQMGMEESFLGFVPQSQSTPGALKVPSKSSVKPKSGRLSVIRSSDETCGSMSPQPAFTESQADQRQDQTTSARVQSLPSLNYKQKVDAWRESQSSLFDTLSLQGFSGISPKKKAYDAVSGSLNRILSERAKGLPPPPVTENSSVDPSKGKWMGGNKENTAAQPSASPCLSTVVMTDQKDEEAACQHQSSPPVNMSHFSDVSLDSDLLTNSQRSNNSSEMKLGASLGAASSVVSLEVDNYAPYWSSKPTTPPKPAELNIEDRIPLYLHNLGINQSPSTILSAFVPRGPIREPEFSPTDLSTIKDSIGWTPTKSVRPSEAGSPSKREHSPSSCDTLQQAYCPHPDQDGATTPQASQNHTLDSPSPASRSIEQSQEEPQRSESSGPRARTSLFGVKSPSEKPGEGSVLQERVTSSAKLTNSPSGARITPSRISQPSRRAEPEGCSAAPPDSTAPPPPLTVTPSPTMDPQEPTSLAADPEDMPEGEQPSPGDPGLRNFSPPIPEDQDQTVLSDGSSQSSLTVRVAKLLQNDSPAGSVTDQDDHKHRRRFLLKLSGGQFESLQLDKEDRQRIEEIKAEMLLNHFVTSESSTDTDSTTASSVAAMAAQHLSDLTRAWTPVLPEPQRVDLVARVQEIATREGVCLARTNVQAHTSINISARKRPASPPLPEPLLLAELSTGSADHHASNKKSTINEEESESTVSEPSSRPPSNISNQRWDAARCQSEDPPPPSEAQDGEEGNSRGEGSSLQDISVSRHGTEDTTIPFSLEPPVQPGYISHVHLTISPKTVAPIPLNTSHLSAEPTHNKFVPLKRSSPVVSSTDEGVGLSSPPEWNENRGPIGCGPEASETSVPLKPPSEPPQAATTSAKPHQSFTAPHSNMTSRSFTPEMPVRDGCASHAAPPVLRPYKPRAAEELFYMPQVEAANVSSSSTTMESSHTGSDDAIPPPFSSEVLGHEDPGLDRGVTIKHEEGIYSKRQHTSTLRTQEAHRGGAVTGNKRSSQVSLTQRETSKMDPVQVGPGGTQNMDLYPQSSGGRVDQSRPVTTDREAWLLEQLQRLSDFILDTRGANEQPVMASYDTEAPKVVGGRGRRQGGKDRETERSIVNTSKSPPPPRQVWTFHPEELGHAPFTSASYPQSRRLCPADRDESTTSTSVSTSTVDTARLIRVFGVHRVQPVKRGSGLQKLYGSISKQRDEWEGCSFYSQTETTVTQESNVTAESSSTSSYVRTSKMAANMVSRGVQAGDLEIVCNATRLHTRDVGTMFPSPGRPQRSPLSAHKQKKSRVLPKPKSVSWFIPVDDLSAEARKENRPEEAVPGPSTVWYDAYRRSELWREPLRPRQEHQQPAFTPPGLKTTTVSSLQEALATRRPDFICRSRQRLHILMLHAEERKVTGQPGGATVLMRAVPWKEMMQRTRRMYDSLPEVQRKRAAERRKAQSQTNRLNVQLYNKGITKRLLENRRAALHANYW
ncbi:serine-rich adhesin for platelets isoform X2 [Dunckerocampus dactyliophorus]|uniref:serine-rich adhesin for platelets isoform X2 n=1 Tax=Dunckerocampus dactyliophorus TaxID=161453 RepID=UPI00240662CA|nr:serine-rich adhesin for platelets isoform X2 [Dunckerocampus dactyliophorus]